MPPSPTPPSASGVWPVAPAPSFADWSPPDRERRPSAPSRPPAASDVSTPDAPADRKPDGQA